MRLGGKMTTSERIEANANLTLWCVCVAGPDDIYAAPSHLAAKTQAHEMNKLMHSKNGGAFDDVLLFAYAAPWPHTKETHEKSVKNWEILINKWRF